MLEVHCEYFSKLLINLFRFYNPEFKSESENFKDFIFVNSGQDCWNSSLVKTLDELEDSIRGRTKEGPEKEIHLCLFLPELVTLGSS